MTDPAGTPDPGRAPLTSRLSILVAAMMVLVLQIATTRILSATVSHHAAFAVIALVMLGLAASASAVFVQRNRAQDPARLPAATNAFLIAAGLCVLTSLGYTAMHAVNWPGFGWVAVILAGGFLFFSVFYAAGYGVAFLLAEYPGDVARVYWFDLTGAAFGCLLIVPMLDAMSPLVVVLWCGAMVAGAGLLLALDPADGRRPLAGGVLAATILLALLGTAWPGMTALGYAKRTDQSDVLWETWNRLSRVHVQTDIPGYASSVREVAERFPGQDAQAIVDRWRVGWGMSTAFDGAVPDIHWLLLDTDAGTQIIEGGARLHGTDALDYLTWDVTAFAHHLRRDDIDHAFVIGGGGGRDILTALHFGAEAVDVAELNPSIVHAVDEVFGEYSGRVYSLPQVHTTVGEARSILSRRDTRYDLIQMSMIDTWASSVAGALVLSENALYTREAFELYLRHLDDDGLFTVSRWSGTEGWGEASRTLALMGAALRAQGVERPEDHVAVVQAGGRIFPGVATCVMKKTPFTDAERALMGRVATERQFTLLWPLVGEHTGADIDVPAILAEDAATAAAMHLDLEAPTDDRPFFFNLRPIFKSWYWQLVEGVPGVGSRSLAITGALFVIFLLVGRILSIAPLQRHNAGLPEAEQTHLRAHLLPLLYFGGIGLGFILVEVTILQRYLIFLGHPTYAMSVVLFSLLLSSGLGANLSERFDDPSKVRIPLALILVGVVFTGFAIPPMLEAAHGWDLSLRIVLAGALVAPLGLCMGMIYPMGVRLLSRDGIDHLVPWVWSINGIAGSIGSVFAIMVAISQGYTVVILLGALAYGVTAVAASRSWRVAT